MRKKHGISVLFLLIAFNGMAQKNIQKSTWHKTAYTTEAIPRLDYKYNSESKLLYLFTNDDAHLYINLIATEQQVIRTILSQGLTVWIDLSAKNKRKLGVQFPMKRERQGPPPNRERGETRTGDEEDRPQLPENGMARQLELIGFYDQERSVIIDADKEGDVNGNFHLNEGQELIYQLKIPYQRFGLSNLVGHVMSINIVSGTMDSSSGGPSGGGGRQGGGPPNGGGSRGGGQGGPPGGGRGQGAGMSRPQQSSTSIKIKVKKLALVSFS